MASHWHMGDTAPGAQARHGRRATLGKWVMRGSLVEVPKGEARVIGR